MEHESRSIGMIIICEPPSPSTPSSYAGGNVIMTFGMVVSTTVISLPGAVIKNFRLLVLFRVLVLKQIEGCSRNGKKRKGTTAAV